MFLDLNYGQKLIERSPQYGPGNSGTVQAQADLKWLQRGLGIPDTGKWDPQTEMAIKAFQQTNPDLPETGQADTHTFKKIYQKAVTKRRIGIGLGVTAVLVIGGIWIAN